MAELTTRAQRMVDSAPEYYAFSDLYTAIQQAVADEFDQISLNDDDLQKQTNIMTATWGLRYFEQRYRIPTILTDSYEIRRSRVLARRRGIGKFSAALVKRVAEAFTNGKVEVSVDVSTFTMYIKFVDAFGIPPNLDDLKAQLENIVHANTEIVYQFRYLLIRETEAMTIDQMQATTLDKFAGGA